MKNNNIQSKQSDFGQLTNNYVAGYIGGLAWFAIELSESEDIDLSDLVRAIGNSINRLIIEIAGKGSHNLNLINWKNFLPNGNSDNLCLVLEELVDFYQLIQDDGIAETFSKPTRIDRIMIQDKFKRLLALVGQKDDN